MPLPYICVWVILFVFFFFFFRFLLTSFFSGRHSLIVLLEIATTLPYLSLSFSLLCFSFLLNMDHCLTLHILCVFCLPLPLESELHEREVFFQPGSVHPSSGNLVISHSQEVTILMLNLVQTPNWRSVPQPRTPGLTESSRNPPAQCPEELGPQAHTIAPEKVFFNAVCPAPGMVPHMHVLSE